MASYRRRGARFQVDWYEHGRRWRKTLDPGSTAADAEALCEEIGRRLSRGLRVVIPGDLTFAQLVEKFIAAKESKRESATVSGYRKHGRRFEERFPCRLRLADIGPEEIDGYLKARVKHDGISERTANKERTTLATMFNWARDRGLCPTNPVKLVDPFSSRAIPAKPCPPELYREVVGAFRLDAAAVTRGDHKLVRLLAADLYDVIWAMGIRMGEACALVPGDVDPEAWTVTIRSARNKGPRVLPIPEEVQEVFERRLDLAYPWVFASHGDFAYWRFYKFWCRWLERHPEHAGAHPHALRHAFQRRHEKAGTPADMIQKLMGHSTPEMHQHYSHRDVADMRRWQGAVTPPPPVP